MFCVGEFLSVGGIAVAAAFFGRSVGATVCAAGAGSFVGCESVVGGAFSVSGNGDDSVEGCFVAVYVFIGWSGG